MKAIIAVNARSGGLMSARGVLKLVASLALATAAVSPALAGSVSKTAKHKTMSSYAQSVPTHVGQSPHAVYWGNQYVGADPDPNIRAALLRQGPSGTY